MFNSRYGLNRYLNQMPFGSKFLVAYKELTMTIGVNA